jgi:hypothetical protein
MKAELIAERVGHNDGGALIYRRYRHCSRARSAKPSRCSTAWWPGPLQTPKPEARRVVNRWSADTSAPRKKPAWLSGGMEWAVLGSNQ